MWVLFTNKQTRQLVSSWFPFEAISKKGPLCRVLKDRTGPVCLLGRLNIAPVSVWFSSCWK